MRKFTWLSVLALAGCGAEAAPDPLPPPPPGQGFQIGMDIVSPPHSETWKCRIMPWPEKSFVDVHRVEHVQSPAMHHMDITVLLQSGVQNLPPGEYDCADLYRDHPALMEETQLYASQTAHAVIELPPGVAAEVPPGITVLYELHHVNASDHEQHLFSRVNAWTIPAREVTGTIYGGAVRDRYLNIPPGQDHTEWTRCVFDVDVDLLLLTSHTHRLGRDVKIFAFDGKTTGAQLFENDDWASPKLLQLPQPLHIPAGQGLEFRCHYFNDTDAEVHWGFLAADEMCNMALVVTPGEKSPRCRPVETSDGMVVE